MNLIKWKEDYSVGVKELDKQHQKLIELINNFNLLVEEHEKLNEIPSLIDKLFDYMEEHLKTEEGYMKKYNYPNYEEHVAEHENFFVNNIKSFRNKSKEKKLISSIEIMDFLTNWFVEHIQITDKEYTKFFNELGIT